MFVAIAEVYAVLDGNVGLDPSRLLELQDVIAKGATFTEEKPDEP
jgi:hypothetical protein